MIELVELTKRFGGRGPINEGGTVAVDRVSFTVAAGERLVLLGSSGSGKTTTLRMMNRLIEPSEGSLRLFGEDARALPAPELRRRIGYVFQRIGLFPHLTVAENVGITPSLLGWPKPKIRARVDELLELVELDPATYRGRPPAALSGGQQQRVGVARALAAEPRVMLLDEPFGALDPATRETLQARFLEICESLSLTAIFVTHDMAEAFALGDRIAIMRSARLVQVGTPRELLEHPADEEVRALVETPLRQADQVRSLLTGAAIR